MDTPKDKSLLQIIRVMQLIKGWQGHSAGVDYIDVVWDEINRPLRGLFGDTPPLFKSKEHFVAMTLVLYAVHQTPGATMGKGFLTVPENLAAVLITLYSADPLIMALWSRLGLVIPDRGLDGVMQLFALMRGETA